jgi:hypothetical protein
MITLNAVTGITSPNIDSPVGDNTPAAGDFTTVNVSGALTAGTLNTGGGVLSPQTGFKNRIINGGMTIDQRNNGAAVTAGSLQYTVDRWRELVSPVSKFTIQRNAGAVTPPVGFINYLGMTSTSAYSVAAADFQIMQQFIEGFNVSDFAWGTANAQAVTVSFWVRSSLTGLFGGSIQNNGNTRSYPFSYTINAANTWEQKTITIAGDTSGTWLTDNGRGLALNFSLGTGTTNSGTAGAWAAADYRSATGATSVVGTSGATFYITGVQLEKGSVATPFEFRSIGTELELCQRYYEILSPIAIMFPWNSGTQVIRASNSFRTTKRASPSISLNTKTSGTGTLGVATGYATGVIYSGSSVIQDVVSYDAPTASAEL